MSSPRSTILRGFSRFLPEQVITNDDLSKRMDTSDEWITQRTGIKERRWVEAPTTTSDLGVEAAKKCFESVGTSDVDAIIAATLSPDFNFPGIGVSIQSKLGLPTVPAFDLRNQCSGFLYAVEMADALVKTGVYKRILIVGAEVHSTGIDITTRGRDIAVLFGDGAGAVVAEASDHPTPSSGVGFEIQATEMHSNGDYVEELWCEHMGSAHFPIRMDIELIEQAKIFPTMNGKKVFEHAVKSMGEVARSVLAKVGIDGSEIRLLVPHQANLRINQMIGKQLGLSKEQVFNTIEKYGNTTAATIPIGMSHAVEEVDLKAGDHILSAAFGSGFTWGAAVWKAVSD